MICGKNCCVKSPSFNYKNMGPKYCNIHKEKGMINVRHKKCLEEGCNVMPVHNYPNKPVGIYCKKHKLDGMIDVKSRKCEHADCKTQPSFNYENESGCRYCNVHKKEGMINKKRSVK